MHGHRGAGIVPFLIIPGGPIVSLRGRVETRVKPVFRELEAFLHDEGGVGVVGEIFFGDPVIFDRIVKHSAQKRNICAGANLKE